MSWLHVIDVGHTAVMIPLAGAMVAWFVAGGAWRLALWWCALFLAGLSLVAISKIAFLGWGMALQPIGFKALSGHAFRATAVFPVLLYLALQGRVRRQRGICPQPGLQLDAKLGLQLGPQLNANLGLQLGLALGMGLGALLVVFGYHTVSEVLASIALGGAVVAAFVRVADAMPVPLDGSPARLAGGLTLAFILALAPASVSPRLVDLALYLSGREQPYRWSTGRVQHPPSISSAQRIVMECKVRKKP